MPTFPTLTDTFRLERLALPAKGQRVVIDTDTNNEIDDQFALVHALLSPEITVGAVYAAPFKNAHAATAEAGMEQSYDEILNVYEHLGLPDLPPVFKGSRRNLSDLGTPEKSPVTDHLIDLASASDEPLYVLAIGAITNVANALLLEPKLVEKLVVVWLGGHAHHWPHTWEFNLEQDVLGASLVLDSGVPLVHLPCQGVVSKLHTTVPELERFVRGQGRVGDYLFKLFAEHVTEHHGGSKELWDMAVIAYMLKPAWFETDVRPSPYLMEKREPRHIGWSFDPRRHPLRYVYNLHRDPVMRDFFGKLEGAAGH